MVAAVSTATDAANRGWQPSHRNIRENASERKFSPTRTGFWRLPRWKIRRRKTIWFTWRSVECIRLGNPEVKTEILAKNNHGKPVNRFSRVGWFGVSFFILPLALLLGPSSSIAHSHYLFVWAMEVSHPEAKTIDELKVGLGKDFLAAFDVAPNASPFGKLVAMLPVGEAELAHHTNYALPPNDVLYANDRMGNSTYVFDLRDGSHPGLLRKFGNVGVYGFPHSFVPLSNGHEVATFQYSGGFNKAPGGLVEFDTDGRIVRSSSAADPQVDPNIRPYSLAVIPKLDRVVTGSADMMGAQVSHAVQIWRLSDLKLLNTIA